MAEPLRALPAGSRILHIGLPKTGTTALQQAFAATRAELRRDGVLYPGAGMNHINEASAFMERPSGWDQTVPDIAAWDAALAEMEAMPSARAILSYEQISESDDAMAARFALALGDAAHVLITLRPYAAMVPSAWQQFVKNGYTQDLQTWLDAVLAGDEERAQTPLFFQCYDVGEQVERWARVAGPENVTVVMADSAAPSFLFDTVGELLGVPHGRLRRISADGYTSNRGLTAIEAAAVLAINRELEPLSLNRRAYSRLVAHGAIESLLRERVPARGEIPVALPSDVREPLVRRAHEAVERVQAAGVRVVGDLELFSQLPPAQGGASDDLTTAVPNDLAALLIGGLVSRVVGRGVGFQGRPRAAEASAAAAAANEAPRLELLRAAAARVHGRRYGA